MINSLIHLGPLLRGPFFIDCMKRIVLLNKVSIKGACILFKSLLLLLTFLNLSQVQALVLEELIENNQLEEIFAGKTVGYYTGSFDPLHKGHEAVAHLPVDLKICDYVLIVPAWGKDSYKSRVDVKIRLDMLFAVFKDDPHVIVTRLNPQDMQRALTKPNLENKYFVIPRFKDLKFIGMIGSDVALELSKEENTKRRTVMMSGLVVQDNHKDDTAGGIIALPCKEFLVTMRKGEDISNLKGLLDERQLIPINLDDEVLSKGYSSTDVRKALQQCLEIEDMVSPAVRDIIIQQNLYR